MYCHPKENNQNNQVKPTQSAENASKGELFLALGKIGVLYGNTAL